MTHKAVGFDRPMPEADFDQLDLPPTGTRPIGVPGAERHGGARNRHAHVPGRCDPTVFAEVVRLVRAGGLFVFHVNALEDRPLRACWLPAHELEPDYVAEKSGQTMHFS